MNPKEVEEIKQVIEQASQGNYVPLLIIASVIVFCFSIIIVLLVAWYKKDVKITDSRLKDHSHLLNEVTKAQIQNSKILAVHEAELNQLKEAV